MLTKTDIIRDKKEIKFPFVHGSSYKGDWKDGSKEGFGILVENDGTKYEGEWLGGRRHGKGTLWAVQNKKSIKRYIGEWINNHMDGFGIYYYEDGQVYSGKWRRGNKSGQGKQDYGNGDYYEGEWKGNVRHGQGALFLTNGNIYEGHWMHDKKEGPGRYFYAATRKIYEGEWVDDQPTCGEYRDPSQEEETRFNEPSVWKTKFELPPLELQDPRAALDSAIAHTRSERSTNRGVSSVSMPMGSIEVSEKIFFEINSSDVDREAGVVSFGSIAPILETLIGTRLTEDELRELGEQFGTDFNFAQKISFPEIVDLATFISSAASGNRGAY